LSSQLKNYLSQENVSINIENVVKNCNNLLENPVVIKSGVFAFLEILDKIFSKLNLDSKNVKIMDIKNLNNLKNVDDILNSLDSEIVEK
jgi:phosphoribosylaminoimidazole carboxylase (NCAIR synthetase)